MQSCTVHQQPSVRTPGNSARPLRRCGRKPFQATTARQPCRASLRQEASDAALDTEDRSNAQSTSTSRRSLLHLASVAALSLALPQVQQLTVHTPAAWAAEPASLRPLSKAEQDVVAKAMKAAIPKAKAPVVLRLVFHDAGTYSKETGDGGCNASIRYELDRAENFGLKRGWRVVEQVQSSLKNTPAAGLSFADLIALAGAHAVAISDGPRIPVRVGRRDAAAADADGRLPELTYSAAQQKATFARMGFSAREFIVLMGSHTIGSKGFGAYDKFDNVYYSTLLQRPWTNTKDDMASMIGLPSDHVLPDDPELEPMIQEYAKDQAAFFTDFTNAYIKLSELGQV